MCRLVDCFENSLVEGRIYRYTLSPKAAAIFPGTPIRVGEGVAHTIPDPTPSAPRPAAGTLCPAAGAIGDASPYIEYAAIYTDSKPFAANNGSY